MAASQLVQTIGAADGSPRASPLAHRVAAGGSAAEVAAATVEVWQVVAAALRPVIGQRGMVALYNRSVHLTAQAYPWLASAGPDAPAEMDLSAMKDRYALQSPAAARACADAMFHGFHDLLSSLIGAALTERLLRPAWDPSSAEPRTQDLSP